MLSLIPAFYEALYTRRLIKLTAFGHGLTAKQVRYGDLESKAGVKTDPTLLEIARDILIRRYGMKSLAMKHLRGLVNALAIKTARIRKSGGTGTSAGSRRKLLDSVGGDAKRVQALARENARFLLFAKLAGVVLDQEEIEKGATVFEDVDGEAGASTSPPGVNFAKHTAAALVFFELVSADLFSSSKELTKVLVKEGDVLLTDLYKSFEFRLHAVWASEQHKADLDQTIADLGDQVYVKDHLKYVNMEMAMLKVLRFWPTELYLREHASKLEKAKACLSRIIRARGENKRMREVHRERWGRWFDAYDKLLHGEDHASGVFTYEEFRQMVNVARRHEKFPRLTEELAMHAFNSWNDNLDPGLNGASYHDPADDKEEQAHRIDLELAAVKIQNLWRLSQERTAELDPSHYIVVSEELRKYRARVRMQIRMAHFFWSATTFVDEELQDEAAAAAAEAMRGSENARTAFARVIVGLGFHLEEETSLMDHKRIMMVVSHLVQVRSTPIPHPARRRRLSQPPRTTTTAVTTTRNNVNTNTSQHHRA